MAGMTIRLRHLSGTAALTSRPATGVRPFRGSSAVDREAIKACLKLRDTCHHCVPLLRCIFTFVNPKTLHLDVTKRARKTSNSDRARPRSTKSRDGCRTNALLRRCPFMMRFRSFYRTLFPVGAISIMETFTLLMSHQICLRLPTNDIPRRLFVS